MSTYDKIKTEIRILDYAAEIGLHPKMIGTKYYTLKEHDSVRIDPIKNIFFQNSTGARGSIIDFALTFTSLPLGEILADFEKRVYSGNNVKKEIIDKKFVKDESQMPAEKLLVLPRKDVNMKNVFAYLIKQRMIDKDIVGEMVHRKMLYQDQRKNCVFVSYKNKEAVFATIRGTNTYKKYVGDAKGCDYSHSFFIDNRADKLLITESVIDAMSKMELFKMASVDYHLYNYLVIAGTGKFEAALKYHINKRNYEEIRICTDNDSAGLLCAINIDKFLYNNKFKGKIIKDLPRYKDVNDDLKNIKGKRED